MRAYRLLKDGQIVHVFRSTTTAPDGREEHLTKGEVGHSGQVFTTLAQHEIDTIEAGEREGLWEVIELPDPVETESGPTGASPVQQSERSDYDAMEPRELVALAAQRGLEVEGTGAGGRTLKSDVVTALRKSDEEE